MGIFGSVGRYLRTRGRLLYTEALAFNARPVGRRKRGELSARAKYIEYMEPRLLMTTLYGGETFQYAGSNTNVTVTLTGNNAAELVAAVQTGGLAGNSPPNAPADTGNPDLEGNLLFGDIAGTITSGPRNGTIIGNGALPTTTGSTTSSRVQIAGLSYTSIGDQINVQGISANAAGNMYAFNLFDVDATGATQQTNGSTQWTLQVLQLTNSTAGFSGATTVLATNPTVTSGTTSSLIAPLGANSVTIQGAAFNPLNGLLYVDVHTEIAATGTGTGSGTQYQDTIYTLNTQTEVFTSVGTLSLMPNQSGVPQLQATAMSFVLNGTAPNTGALYIAEEPSATNAPPVGQGQNIFPQLVEFADPIGGAVSFTTPTNSLRLSDGFGTLRAPLTGVVGLSGLPASFAGGGSGYIFAAAAGTSNTSYRLVRIDLSSGEGTDWGNTTDLAERSSQQIANGAIDGNSDAGLAFNPVAIDPFTGQSGAFVSVDSATGDLMFVNHQLRISKGDVYGVYSNVSDINSAITFQGGGTLYVGGAGAMSGLTPPATTGQVFLGYRGEVPDPNNATNYIQNQVFLTGQLTNQIGSLPGMVADLTDPLTVSTAAPTNKLFAGFSVGNSLEQPYFSGDLSGSLLGANFKRTTGLAISADGTMAIMNSNVFNQSLGDQLGFYNPFTGDSTVIPVQLGNGTLLKNVEAMAYGDPNLTGTEQLYAVYDLHDGNGPTLGTINTTTGVFTKIGTGLLLGANGKVTAMAFTRGGTTADPTHETLYLAADPNSTDDDLSETLYTVAVSSGQVVNAPTFGGGGLVLARHGIGTLRDSSGQALQVTSATFTLDQNRRLLVLDGLTGRVLDVNLTTGRAGANVASPAGSVSATVSGIAYDPATLQFVAVDNITGTGTFEAASTTDSAILMTLKDPSNPALSAENMGRFLEDGVFTGKVYVSGSLDEFYAGWIVSGEADVTTTWLVPQTMDGASGDSDSIENENYFRNDFYAGGDIRNVLSLTDIGLSYTVSSIVPIVEISAAGKIGEVRVDGNMYGLVHASDKSFIPNLTDSSSLNGFGGTTPYAFTMNGGMLVEDDIAELTTVPNTSGSVFGSSPQPIDTFTTNFTFNALGTGGLAFVMQNSSLHALGASANGLGYAGVLASAAVEFTLDPTTHSDGKIGFAVNGVVNTTIDPVGIDFSDDHTIDATLTYDGTGLQVTLLDENNGSTFSTTFVTNLAAVVGGPSAYVGFTAASGSGSSFVEISGFTFAGSEPGQTALPKEEVQYFNVDSDHTFAAGYLTNASRQTFIPFDNSNATGAQYLGTVASSIPGQPNLIHLQGEIDNNPTASPTELVDEGQDYFAFGALAGQTITVTVIPREDSNLTDADEEPISFSVIDPDGRVIASDSSTWLPSQTNNRAVVFTATMPGVYMVEVSATVEGNTTADNIPYDLTIAGVGDDAIGGVVANGQIQLNGSAWVANSPSNTGSVIVNPSIYSDVGDIGAVVAGASGRGTTAASGIISSVVEVGLSSTQSPSTGYALVSDSSEDIAVYKGNLRAVIGGTMGTVTTSGNVNTTSEYLDILVNGTVGLLQTYPSSQTLTVFMSHASVGDIQTIDSGGNLQGVFRTDKGIGVIRAASVINQTFSSEFHADVDQQGDDGIIDLIDVSGNWGDVTGGGAALVTGPGGDVRIMNVGGVLWQDPIFSSGLLGTRGEVVHSPGVVTLRDDTGATLTLNPGTLTTTTVSTSGTLTTTSPGVITTRTYGVRGAGGTVIVDIESSAGLTVTASAGGSGRAAEIGTIQAGTGGIPVTVGTNGVPVVGTATAGASAINVVIQASDNTRVDVFTVTDTGTIDSISNTTGGDIANMSAQDIGSINSQGNIGSMVSASGVIMNPIAVFSNTYPFVDQRFGISAGNIGSIQAWGSIGNVLASGVIGSITADAGQGEAGQFDGINGPIVANGTATASGNSDGIPVSITSVDIGMGIPFAGSGSVSLAGIYAAGKIVHVTGTDADIRGAIVSEEGIGTISLTNGSLIDARIDVLSTYGQASELFTGALTFVNLNPSLEKPIYNINNITINGNGGILGTQILAASIDTISVPNGFGIVSTDVEGEGDGTINKVTAGGLGLRDVILNDAVVNNVTATGNGGTATLGSFSTSVRHSESDPLLDPLAGMAPNDLTDLDVYLSGDGIVSFPDPGGLQTGLISSGFFSGPDSLGAVKAYTILDSEFDFARATGTLTATNDINDLQVITGAVKIINVAHNADNLDVTAAGKIGPVNIGGNFEVGTESVITTLSQIIAKGPSGDIGNVTVNGNFSALLQADSGIGQVTVGTAGTKTVQSAGDFSGTIIVGGNHLPNAQLNLLKLFGGLVGGVIDIVGNVGTIDIAHDFASLSGDTVINGNVNSIIVGDDPARGDSIFSAPMTVTGNVGSVAITGQMTGNLTVQGNLGKFTLNRGTLTACTDQLTGQLTVGGTLTSITVPGPFNGTLETGYLTAFTTGGDLTGKIIGAEGIGNLTISGNLVQGAQVVSSLGSIQKLVVTGSHLDGSVTANKGTIVGLSVNGSIGATSVITAQALGTMSVAGLVMGSISSLTTIGAVNAGGIAAGADITGGIGSLTTIGDMLGTVNSGINPSGTKFTIGHNLGGISTFASPATILVTNDVVFGALIESTSNLTALTVNHNLNGDVLIDQTISAITAASMNGATVIGGLGISSLKVTGAVNNSVIGTGLSQRRGWNVWHE